MNSDALYHNAKKIATLCHENNIRLVAVTKVLCGNPEIANIYLEAGADAIGDSRIQNIIRMKENGVKGPFMLIRIPMISEIPYVVENVDVILVSEIGTLKEISKYASKMRKKQKVLYMVDVGDLREGVWYPKAVDEIIEAASISSIELYGIGTNLGCYGGVIPDEDRMNVLIEVAKAVGKKGVRVNVISGGNTAAIQLIENGTLPSAINEYRIGEAIALGTDITNGKTFSFLRQDTFVLESEVVEVKVKPSVPQGKIGKDSMGRTPHFEDKGMRLKAIVALGEQDIASDGVIPTEKGIEVLHASSDHMVLDVTECKREIKVGDTVKFNLKYSALLRAMTSTYVEKIWNESDRQKEN
ncbi:alanine/ornithine racemase family PLP-dependent enzyme [Mesoaciditoga lauensis]|uniref:alanine/ornithine racemase family PLP-dependent enzyme n=1 Tax=Mesoaciditoga lauensis TaxID=1495039 RepID=UPI0024806AC9|nr:alanine/ornithine racemase family PLP-dependent enzyme [Mesoaciditoga lauensis]